MKCKNVFVVTLMLVCLATVISGATPQAVSASDVVAQLFRETVESVESAQHLTHPLVGKALKYWKRSVDALRIIGVSESRIDQMQTDRSTLVDALQNHKRSQARELTKAGIIASECLAPVVDAMTTVVLAQLSSPLNDGKEIRMLETFMASLSSSTVNLEKSTPRYSSLVPIAQRFHTMLLTAESRLLSLRHGVNYRVAWAVVAVIATAGVLHKAGIQTLNAHTGAVSGLCLVILYLAYQASDSLTLFGMCFLVLCVVSFTHMTTSGSPETSEQTAACVLFVLLVAAAAVGLSRLTHSPVTKLYKSDVGEFTPMQLVARLSDSEALELNTTALEAFNGLQAPFLVHAVAGVMRSRKSTCLTLILRTILADADNNPSLATFEVGHAHTGKTTGVWMVAIPIRKLKPGVVAYDKGTLILLDTEGLADPGKSRIVSHKLFSFATLMASSLTINVIHNVDANEMRQLAAVSFLADSIDAANTGRSAVPWRVMPSLSLLVTDGSLFENRQKALDAILEEDMLAPMLATRNDMDAYRSAECIKRVFHERHLYVAEVATDAERQRLQRLPSIPGLPLGPFTSSVQAYARDVLRRLQPLAISGSPLLTPSALRSYVEMLVEQVSSSKVHGVSVEMIQTREINRVKAVCKENLKRRVDNLVSTLPIMDNSILERNLKVFDDVEDELWELMSLQNIAVDLRQDTYAEFQELVTKQTKAIRAMNAVKSKIAWETDEFGPCTPGPNGCPSGVRTRGVRCRRGDGLLLDRALCPEPAPKNTEECYFATYDWSVGAWGACDQSCPAVRSRSVTCKSCDGTVASDLLCALELKPESTIVCGLRPSLRPTVWSNCSSECGAGTRHRSFECRGCDGTLLGHPEDADWPCDRLILAQQEHVQACNTHSCESTMQRVSRWAAYAFSFIGTIATSWPALQRLFLLVSSLFVGVPTLTAG